MRVWMWLGRCTRAYTTILDDRACGLSQGRRGRRRQRPEALWHRDERRAQRDAQTLPAP